MFNFESHRILTFVFMDDVLPTIAIIIKAPMQGLQEVTMKILKLKKKQFVEIAPPPFCIV